MIACFASFALERIFVSFQVYTITAETAMHALTFLLDKLTKQTKLCVSKSPMQPGNFVRDCSISHMTTHLFTQPAVRPFRHPESFLLAQQPECASFCASAWTPQPLGPYRALGATIPNNLTRGCPPFAQFQG
jgi:hypothetical protein